MIRFLALLALWFVQTTIDQYNALIGQTLSRGRSSGNVATAGNLTMDAPVGGSDVVTLEASLAAAGVAGDLTVACYPFAADGTTVLTTPLPAVAGIGYPPTLASGTSAAVQQYNVQGIDKVRFIVTNNNAATKTITASWRVENN